MKTLFLILVFSVAAFPQSTTQPLQPAPAQTPEKWLVLSPDNEVFSIQMPLGGRVLENVSNDGSKKLTMRNYNAESDNTFFVILSEPVSNPLRSKKNSQIDAALKYVSSFNPVTERLKVDDYNGTTYESTDAEDFHHKALFLETGARSYVFLTVSQTKDAVGSERFFKSLRVSKVSPATGESISSNLGDITAVAPSGTRGTGGSAQGSSSGGIGNNAGSGIGSGTRLSVPPAQTAKIKISSKPRPGYTDNARIFGMAGTVRLRVQFLSTGEIGEVEIIKRLPFGLTLNAVEAAKSIGFEPAAKEGRPVTTSAIIEYSFTLY